MKELLDFAPVLNILASIGFARKHCPRESKSENETGSTMPTEEVLILEGEVPTSQIRDLLNRELFGLSYFQSTTKPGG